MQYGGLSRAGDLENGPPKPASEFTIKGGEKVFLEIDGIEVCTAPQFCAPFVHWGTQPGTFRLLLSLCNFASLSKFGFQWAQRNHACLLPN